MFGRPTPEQRQAATEARKAANMAALCLPARTLHRATYEGGVTKPAPPERQKTPGKVRQSIRDSAKGEDCTVRIPGVCNSDPATVVWSHYPENAAGKGMGTKSLDAAGCYACATCHDVVDGRKPRPAGMTRAEVLLAWHEGHLRSLVRLAQKGLL